MLAVLLGLAPVVPEPHLIGKLRMLREGTLTRGIDVFDLAWHGMPLVLLAAKLARSGLQASRRARRGWRELRGTGGAAATCRMVPKAP